MISISTIISSKGDKGMKKTLVLLTALLALSTTVMAKDIVSHEEFKALDGTKVLVHYDDGTSELMDEQDFLNATISMTQKEMDDLHKVDEGTKEALKSWQAQNDTLRTLTIDTQQEQKQEKKKHWYDNVLDGIF